VAPATPKSVAPAKPKPVAPAIPAQPIPGPVVAPVGLEGSSEPPAAPAPLI
jgi:hypothetical protein